MPTFKEQQDTLTKAQHELAVWEALHSFIDDNFIAHDGGVPKKVIKVPDCLQDKVSEEVLEDILKFMSMEKIDVLKELIKSINSREVVVMSAGGN